MNANKNRVTKAVTFNAMEFAGWVEGTHQNLPESFCGVTQDTRDLKPDMLYVAVRGERYDGHDFIQKAFDAGASAALVDQELRAVPGAVRWPLIRVADTRRALLDAARAWRACSTAKIIGVTGSSGKTTTREITAALLSGAGRVGGTYGNRNNEIGLPLSILSMAPGCEFGLFELGTNHPGEIALLAETLLPDVAVITSVGSAHIENFGSTEAIADEKGALLNSLACDGFAVLSLEMTHFERLRHAYDGRVVTISLMDKSADFHGEVLDAMCGQVAVTEKASGARLELRSGLPGQYNIYNLLLSFAVARGLGIDAEIAEKSLGGIDIPGMRWQRLKTEGGVNFINDAYNANPESVKAVLEVFQRMASVGRKVAVLGDMLELGAHAESGHRGVGAAAGAMHPDLLCLVGPLARRFVAPEAVSSGLAREKVLCFEDAAAAGRELAGWLRADDLVLLKGSRGMRLEEVLDEF